MAPLEDIGFYTLSNARAKNSSVDSPLWRCELILTGACNFKCPYCRGLSEHVTTQPNAYSLPYKDAEKILQYWVADGLKNLRLSGGEPLLWPGLVSLVEYANRWGVERIAISTNGSLSIKCYGDLINAGVNDISISLDGCCASIGDKMSGVKGSWEKVIGNIRALSRMVYVTVGMVFTEENVEDAVESVLFASSLGVSDIRVIPAAQYNKALTVLADLPDEVLQRHPILKYRIRNQQNRQHVRGIPKDNRFLCRLVLDDMAVAGGHHFPCIIYMREGGTAIGQVGPTMRQDRSNWMKRHIPADDPICSGMCLDVCRDYNRCASLPQIEALK